jgi:hypothetical protein
VYANLEGMANSLVREGRVRNLGQLRAFATGFCGRMAGFDWVDVGVGKEGGAGRKVRGMCDRSPLSFFWYFVLKGYGSGFWCLGLRPDVLMLKLR